jgi:hypothetical protein
MHNEMFSSENLKFSEKAEMVRKVREFGFSAENERLVLLVAMKEMSFAELEFPAGPTAAMKAIDFLDAFGLYIIIKDSSHFSKIIIVNNQDDFETLENENLKK